MATQKEVITETKSDPPQRIGNNKCFGGFVEKWEHYSPTLGGTKARFCVYIPPQATNTNRVPILYFLSGLTCTEDNFITKSGAPQYASKCGIALICPDTSPRGIDIDGDSNHWDFGKGAGFYVNATQKPWSSYYNNYDYIVKELPSTLASIDRFANIFDFGSVSIMGHSMGGHGALMIYLRNIFAYKSCSAFAPICNPILCKWGHKAFSGYLGAKEENFNSEEWLKYDSLELIRNLSEKEKKSMSEIIMIDQGTNDFALQHGDDNHNQLRIAQFEQVCKENDIKIKVRYNDGYGHGYDHIATYIEDHIRFHCKILKNEKKSLLSTVDDLLEYVS